MHSLLASLSRADIRHQPYPHLVVENCLPADYYQTLARAYPSDAQILELSGGDASQNARNDLSAHQALQHPQTLAPEWLDFVRHHVSAAFFREVVALLGPEFRATYPQLERRLGAPLESCSTGVRFHPELDTGAISLDCQIGINTPTRYKSSVRRVHTDATDELFAMLLYLRRDDDTAAGGDLEIYRWKDGVRRRFIGEAVDEGDAEFVGKVPYRPNTLVVFVNSAISLHAVSAREKSEVSRRLVNVIGRAYRGVPEGLFEKPQKGFIDRQRYRLVQAARHRVLPERLRRVFGKT